MKLLEGFFQLFSERLILLKVKVEMCLWFALQTERRICIALGYDDFQTLYDWPDDSCTKTSLENNALLPHGMVGSAQNGWSATNSNGNGQVFALQAS